MNSSSNIDVSQYVIIHRLPGKVCSTQLLW